MLLLINASGSHGPFVNHFIIWTKKYLGYYTWLSEAAVGVWYLKSDSLLRMWSEYVETSLRASNQKRRKVSLAHLMKTDWDASTYSHCPTAGYMMIKYWLTVHWTTILVLVSLIFFLQSLTDYLRAHSKEVHKPRSNRLRLEFRFSHWAVNYWKFSLEHIISATDDALKVRMDLRSIMNCED